MQPDVCPDWMVERNSDNCNNNSNKKISMETIFGILSVVLCFAFCIFMLAFYLQLIGVVLEALKSRYLWVWALIGISIYVILMCSKDSWMWIFPKTLGFIFDFGGGLFCMIATIYLIWKTFTSWKFFLGMLTLSTLVGLMVFLFM